jgi:hypothetical protein
MRLANDLTATPFANLRLALHDRPSHLRHGFAPHA